MSGFIEGEDRNQGTLFPERIDDYVAEDNPVRVIDESGCMPGSGPWTARIVTGNT